MNGTYLGKPNASSIQLRSSSLFRFHTSIRLDEGRDSLIMTATLWSWDFFMRRSCAGDATRSTNCSASSVVLEIQPGQWYIKRTWYSTHTLEGWSCRLAL